MPGMMDTILNLGLNDVATEGLATTTGNERFAYDSYRRLIQMYGEVVDGIDAHRFEQRLDRPEAGEGRQAGRPSSTPTTCAGSSERSSRSTEEATGNEFPQDAREQLTRAVRGVFESWDNPRAQVYRRAHDIPDDLGTAVNVMQMVFGNKGETSATGVASRATRRRASRASTASSCRTRRARTSSPGIRTPLPARADAGHASRGVRRSCVETMAALERHYRDMQDIEFTVEEGKLYLLQTRSGEAHRRGRAQGGRLDGGGGTDHARGGGRAHRPGVSSTSCCTR